MSNSGKNIASAGDNPDVLLKGLLEKMPVPVVIFGETGKPVYANPKALELFVAETINYKTLNVYDFVSPEYLQLSKQRGREVLSGKDLPPIELETKNTKGKKIFLEVKSVPIQFEGKPAVQTIINNISFRKQLQEEFSQKQSQLYAIINTTNDIVFSVDKEYRIVEFNEIFSQIVKIRHGVEVVRGTLVFDILPQEYHSGVKNRYDNALQGEIQVVTEQFIMLGEQHIYEAHYSPIKINDTITGVAVFSRDVTIQQQVQQEVINKQSQLTAIINTTDDIILSIDKDYRLVQFNNVIQEIGEQRTGKEMKSGMSFLDFLPQERIPELKETYKKALAGKSVEAAETFYHPKTKTYRTYEARYNPIVINGEVTGVAIFSRDVTEKKKIEEEIFNKQNQLSAVINNTTDIVVSIDRQYNIVEFNQKLADMVRYGFGKELKAGMSVLETLLPQYHEDVKNIYERVFAEGQSINAVEMFVSGSNKKTFYETNYNPIKVSGKVTGIAIFSREITDKIASETELRGTLREKEVLLKEVHHRVKNNLQVISSILNLQSSYVKDKETSIILKECQNRIKTMAFIHESLYQTKDFLQINFSDYIVTLVKNLFYSYDASQQKIKVNFDVDPIMLNLDLSIPCGLIVNELVSNALKYAFNPKEQEGGFISIQLKKQKNKKIKMLVADNGRGLPGNIDYKNTESLGLQLVNILVEQINGTLTLKQQNGTSFEITF